MRREPLDEVTAGERADLAQLARSRRRRLTPADPIPPLPRFVHGQRVEVIDAKTVELVAMWAGRRGRISWVDSQRHRGNPPRFIPDGDHRTYQIDTSRHPGPLIVEPYSK